MLSVGVGGVRALIEAVVTAASVLGGAMAYYSGLAAAEAVTEGQPPAGLAHAINVGVAEGFKLGLAAGRHHSYDHAVELMTRLLKSPRRTFYLSCIAATATGIAVMGFGAPPVTVAYVAWGGAILLSMVDIRSRRRLRR